MIESHEQINRWYRKGSNKFLHSQHSRSQTTIHHIQSISAKQCIT